MLFNKQLISGIFLKRYKRFMIDVLMENGEIVTAHLHDLMKMKQAGHRAVLLFLIQRSDGKWFEPAEEIDYVYADTLREAAKAGVEILCFRADVQPEGIELVEGQTVKKMSL